ncbi:hypothetical protein ACFYPT_41835 [Streptomyces sp. NPDC005529]|uniref:hypothetical protein n=1 Tax=unclassified Streptomyces TaxID=2593676 RepID=UPI0033A2A947
MIGTVPSSSFRRSPVTLYFLPRPQRQRALVRRAKRSRLRPGEQFAYVFDMGDDWAHLCTVGGQRIDPLEELGVVPDSPVPYWGWGWG